jgi:MinD superfamily P-loop ATPase
MFALTKDDVTKGNVSIFCTKCGKCIDACPKQAIHYGIAGVPANRMVKFSRNIFLFVSFLFIAIFASGSIITVIKSFVNLFI